MVVELFLGAGLGLVEEREGVVERGAVGALALDLRRGLLDGGGVLADLLEARRRLVDLARLVGLRLLGAALLSAWRPS